MLSQQPGPRKGRREWLARAMGRRGQPKMGLVCFPHGLQHTNAKG